MNTNLRNLCVLLALFAGIHQASAQATTAFTYQGQLRDNGTNANGAYTLIFKLYDSLSGGNQIGSSSTNSPTLANGLFSVNLDFGAGAFNGAARWLDITISNGATTETLSPRVQVLPSPYALFAATAATVTNGAISSAQLAANAVATANIQNGAVTDVKIASVNGSKVTGTVGSATVAISAGSATVADSVAAAVVTSDGLANASVIQTKLAIDAVGTVNIQDGAVTNPKIQDGSVTDAKIDSISGSKVNGPVNLANAVTDGAITTDSLQDGTVTDKKIAPDTTLVSSPETALMIVRGDVASSSGSINYQTGTAVFNVTFPIAFSDVPTVTFGIHTTSGKATGGISSAAASGFTFVNNFATNGGSPSGFSYIAIGPK